MAETESSLRTPRLPEVAGAFAPELIDVSGAAETLEGIRGIWKGGTLTRYDSEDGLAAGLFLSYPYSKWMVPILDHGQGGHELVKPLNYILGVTTDGANTNPGESQYRIHVLRHPYAERVPVLPQDIVMKYARIGVPFASGCTVYRDPQPDETLGYLEPSVTTIAFPVSTSRPMMERIAGHVIPAMLKNAVHMDKTLHRQPREYVRSAKLALSGGRIIQLPAAHRSTGWF